MLAGMIDTTIRRFENHNSTPFLTKAMAKMLPGLLQSKKYDDTLIADIQNKRFIAAVEYTYRYSRYYRHVFSELSLEPGDIRGIEDITLLPFTTAADIMNWQQFLCVPMDQLSAVFTTSGTTGEPKRMYFTFHEMQMLSNLYAVALKVMHPGPMTALIALPLSHGLWIGSASVQRAVERAGGLALPVGANDPDETLLWMKRFEPNVIFSSPSYMSILTKQAERKSYRLPLDVILLAGEVLTEEQKQVFSDYWNASVYDSYGSTEIGGAQTISLPGCSALHLNDLHIFTEIIDPQTGRAADEGELVFTTLRRTGMPLLRYRSGDKAKWRSCGCWLPLKGIELVGRTDDMIVAGDMNLFGKVIADTVGKLKGASGRIRIELSKTDLTDQMAVLIEGKGLTEEKVWDALFTAYPELRLNVNNGNLHIAIGLDVDLSTQMKRFRIVDKRKH